LKVLPGAVILSSFDVMHFSTRSVIVAALAGTFIIVISVICFVSERPQKIDSRLTNPSYLLEGILKSRTSVFLSPSFLPYVPKSSEALIPSIKEADAALASTSAFFRLNREKHFSIVLLDAHPASNHLAIGLLDSPLWVLADVTPWGYLFRPIGSPAWHPPEPNQCFASWSSPSDMTLWLIGTASCLAAIKHLDEAKGLLEIAETTHSYPSLVLTGKASLAAQSGNWEESRRLAEESISKDRSNIPPRLILIRSLIECGNSNDALTLARKLFDEHPKDIEVLFLYARAASSANSNSEEIEALLRLVNLLQDQKQPSGAALAYLAQAYAKNGRRSDALMSFQKALNSPDMTDEQKHSIEEIMDHLMPAGKSSTPLPPLVR